MTIEHKEKCALVLSGGGARGAYEAGVMYYIRTRLPEEIRNANLFQIYSGTSVGAINTAFLAATANDPIYQGARLRALWRELTDENIYRADARALSGFLVRTGFFMAIHFFGLSEILEKQGGTSDPFSFKSILDTTPFVYFLRRTIPWPQIHRNIERRIIDAVTVTATHMQSGKPTLFLEKHPEVDYRRGGPRPHYCTLAPKHVLASAAIPLVFPIIRIDRQFFGDGSLRQNTPMSPAIHLGATRLLVISTHPGVKHEVSYTDESLANEAEPTIGDIFGTLLDSVFMDKVDYDLEQMRRINYLVSDFERLFGEDALDKINALRAERGRNNPEIHSMVKIQPFVIGPSMDIGVLASEHFARLIANRKTLTPMQKFFAKVMEGTPNTNNDLVSFLLFDREYLEALLQLGYEDARRNHTYLENFFLNQPLRDELDGR